MMTGLAMDSTGRTDEARLNPRPQPRSRCCRACFVATAILFAIAGAACRRPPPPNVVWIVVDTLRADHLEWYGYPRQTAPSLRPLVEGGTLFANAYTPQTQTTPAIASMFTGLYPARHGLQDLYVLLHGDNRTAAETFSAAGYDTAAFVSSFVMVREFSNLGQGFATYDDFVAERELYRNNYERKAQATVGLVRRWLQQRPTGRPFFLFVHLIDPHGPYAPPGRFADRFRSSTRVPVEGLIPPDQQVPGERDLNRYVDRYDGEIAYADDALASLFALLRERRLFDPAIVVFAADHGESMGEHGLYFTHGEDVFQPTLHVPLIVKAPASYGPRGRRITAAVSLVDLLPTVLELAGQPVPAGLDGRSLAPFLRGAETSEHDVWASAGLPGARHYWALVAKGRKTVMWREPGGRESVRTFDLAGDPGERAGEPADPDMVARLRTQQQGWAAVHLPFTPVHNFLPLELRDDFVRRHLDPRRRADVERLRSLGYVR